MNVIKYPGFIRINKKIHTSPLKSRLSAALTAGNITCRLNVNSVPRVYSMVPHLHLEDSMNNLCFQVLNFCSYKKADAPAPDRLL